MSDAVVVKDARKTYGSTVALDGVSVSIRSGEVFALLGPNGAGKTTLVRAITGTTPVDEGTVRVFDTQPGKVERSRLGVLPQSFAPPERLTARELIAYYGGLYETATPPDEALAAVGLADSADTRYEDLSGGQQRRTCLAIALVNDPDLVVLDEPTAGIDPAGRRRVRERIADLAAGGATVLLTTHDVAEVQRLVDRVAMLAGGEVVAADAPAALVAEHGGANRLVVETDATPDALDGDGGGIGGGLDVEAIDRGLVVHGVDPADLDDVVATLEAAGVTYDALRWARPDLEDVYLDLTGSPELVGIGSGDLNRTAGLREFDARAGAGADGGEDDPDTTDGGDDPDGDGAASGDPDDNDAAGGER